MRRGQPDARRNIDDECGYPEIVESQDYRDLYDREAVASRVVQVMPLECWQVTPEVYEDEDVKVSTAFELAWANLPKTIRGKSWFQDQEGNPVVAAWLKADILSRIGSFGIILIGIDDGRRLDEPVEGFEEDDSETTRTALGATLGPEAERGPLSLMPGPEKKRDGTTVNMNPNHDPHTGEFTSGGGGQADQQYKIKKSKTFNQDGIHEIHVWDEVRRIYFDRQSGSWYEALERPTSHHYEGWLGHNKQEAINKILEEYGITNNSLTNNDLPPQLRRKRADAEQEDEGTDDAEEPTTYDPTSTTRESAPTSNPDRRPEEGQYAVDEEGEPDEVRDGEEYTGADGEMLDEAGMPQQPLQYEEPERQLLYLRCYDETLVQVIRYEADPFHPRCGQPVMYRVTINDPKTWKGGTGLTMNSVQIHWSRVIHVAETTGTPSEVFAMPVMQPVYNRLLDIKKLHSSSAEMYYKGAFPGYNLVTHPNLGGDVAFDPDDIKNQMEQYMNSLQRYTAFVGMSMNSMAPQVVDPTSQIQAQMEAICVQLGIPMRIFMGSERGELASSQDSGTWTDRLRQRQNNYLTPKLIVPFIDRLIRMKVLPEPQPTTDPQSGVEKCGYSVIWPDVDASSDMEKAQIATAQTQCLANYVSGGIEQIMTFTDYLTQIMGFDDQTAAQLAENAMNQESQQMLSYDPEMDQAMQEAQMEQMTNPDLVPDNIYTGDHHYNDGDQGEQGQFGQEGNEDDIPEQKDQEEKQKMPILPKRNRRP